MANRTEDLLVEHMRTCPHKPPQNPAVEGQHFPHGKCPEYIAIIASISTGPLISLEEFLDSDWSWTEVIPVD